MLYIYYSSLVLFFINLFNIKYYNDIVERMESTKRKEIEEDPNHVIIRQPENKKQKKLIRFLFNFNSILIVYYYYYFQLIIIITNIQYWN